jgi:hypothetical protein
MRPAALRIILGRIRDRWPAALLMAVFGAAALLLAPLAHAGGEPRPGFYQYSIHHTLFGEIGRQTIQLSRQGRDVIVTMEARVKIRILFVTLLRLHTRGREVWRNGRMIAFEGRSEEDGETISVSAMAAPKGMMIKGPKGMANIAGPVALANPWSRAVLDAPIVIEPTSGSLLSIRAEAAGNHWIEASGRAMKARKYVVTGDMEADIWFAGDGTFSRMEFFKAGGRVTIALESFTPSRAFPRDLVAEKAR